MNGAREVESVVAVRSSCNERRRPFWRKVPGLSSATTRPGTTATPANQWCYCSASTNGYFSHWGRVP